MFQPMIFSPAQMTGTGFNGFTHNYRAPALTDAMHLNHVAGAFCFLPESPSAWFLECLPGHGCWSHLKKGLYMSSKPWVLADAEGQQDTKLNLVSLCRSSSIMT